MTIPRGRTSNGLYQTAFLNWPKTSLKAQHPAGDPLREQALEEMTADDVGENRMETK